MSGRGLLKSAVGVLFGACTIGAFLPILLIVPNAVAAGILLIVLVGSVALCVTAQNVRQAVGRSLVTLGSALVMLPIFSLLLGVLLVAPLSDAAAKGDKSREPSRPFSQQVIAACVAFGAGSLVAIAGLVTIMNGQRDKSDLGDPAGKTLFSVKSLRDKFASGVAVSTTGEVQTTHDRGNPEASDRSGKHSAMNIQRQDSAEEQVSQVGPEMGPSVSDGKALAADARIKLASAAIRTLDYMSDNQTTIGMVGARSAAGRQGSIVSARSRVGPQQLLLAKSGSDASGKRQSSGPREPISRSARAMKHLDISERLRAAANAPLLASDEAATQIQQTDTKRKPASRLRERLEAVGYSIPRSDFTKLPVDEVADEGHTS